MIASWPRSSPRSEPASSIHLLGNDNGCVWHQRFRPEAGRVEPFRSGYVNVDCRSEETA